MDLGTSQMLKIILKKSQQFLSMSVERMIMLSKHIRDTQLLIMKREEQLRVLRVSDKVNQA